MTPVTLTKALIASLRMSRKPFGLAAIATAAQLTMGAPSIAEELTFPEVRASDLNGRDVTLPNDLPGFPTLVLVAYEQRHQPDIERWIEVLDLKDAAPVDWIELPVISNRYRFMAPMTDAAMRGAITTFEGRARTITAYGHRRFIRALDIPDTKEVSVILAEPTGEVYLVVRGAPTAATTAEVETVIAAITALAELASEPPQGQ